MKVLLHPLTIAILALVFFATIRYFDTRWRFLPYTFAITLSLAALFFLVSRRPVASLYAAGAVVMLQMAASVVKYKLKGLALHVYDFVFTGSDTSALDFLIANYLSLFITGLMVLFASGLVLAALFRAEKPVGLPVLFRLPLVGVAIVLAWAIYPPRKADEPDYLAFIDGYNASALFLSFGHVDFPLGKLNLSKNIHKAEVAKPFADTVDCRPGRKQPDVFLVLAETQTSPHIYPQLSIPQDVLDSFKSGDGQIRPLFVETFGGGTWVTNFSVMTGLSSADFGWQSSYVTHLMEGRIKGALPDVLARCGYRTVTIMPMSQTFVNEGPFLRSIGVQEIYDPQAMGHKIETARDHRYFEFAERLIAEHRETDKRPLFLSIQTLFPHGPYDHGLVEDGDVASHVFSDVPHANEYMRRVAVSRRDFQAFLGARRDDPGKQGSIVVDYGDHQSASTKSFGEEISAGKNLFADFRSVAYQTYYGVNAFGTEIDYSVLGQPEDVAYLAARVVQAAGLATSPMMTDLQRLSDACGGRFHTCPERLQIDAHLKTRIDAGMLMID